MTIRPGAADRHRRLPSSGGHIVTGMARATGPGVLLKEPATAHASGEQTESLKREDIGDPPNEAGRNLPCEDTRYGKREAGKSLEREAGKELGNLTTTKIRRDRMQAAAGRDSKKRAMNDGLSHNRKDPADHEKTRDNDTEVAAVIVEETSHRTMGDLPVET